MECDSIRRRVVVVGGGVAGLAAAARALEAGADVTLVESASRLGGKVSTERVDGFVVEAGPDTLLTAKPAVVRLLVLLGLGPSMVAPQAARTRILERQRLLPLPEGLTLMVPQRLRPILRTPVLSVAARARAALEIVVPARRQPDDESVRSFVSRRMGAQVYERLAEPLIGGIHAGDVGDLGIRVTFPHLKQDEEMHGSLARAVLRRRWDAYRARRSATRAGHPDPTPLAATDAAPIPPLSAPRSGLGDVVDAMGRALVDAGAVLRLGEAVTGVHPRRDVEKGEPRHVYRVQLSEESLDADAVILAVPAGRASPLCRELDPALTVLLAALPTASVTSVSLGFRTADLAGMPDVQTVAVPAAEGLTMRGCTVVSRRYPDRAPDGGTLVRVMLRGAQQDDAAAVRTATSELAQVLGVEAKPVMSRVHHWKDAMPRYSLGHLDRVAQVRGALRPWPGLAVAGSSYDGAGLPDCIASGQAAADAVLAD